MEALYLYCAFSYLFMLGIVINGWSRYAHGGMIVALALSPIMTPIVAGIYLSESAE
jgi:hypothetical protein